MLKCLGLGMLLLIACSSESGLVSSSAGEGGDGSAGSSGATAAQAGSHRAGAGAGTHAGVGEPAGGEGGAEATMPAGGAGSAGESTEEGGAAGAPGSAGTGGAAGNAGAVSAGGAGGLGGLGGSAGQAGSATAGAGGGVSQPDPCEGKRRWDSTERWTDYAQGDQRVFGGVLWHCQAPGFCSAYPGHSSSPGWLKDTDCNGGPTNEVAECQCAAGQCCDGCYLRPRSHFCGEVVRYARCTGKAPLSCPGSKPDIEGDYWNLFCNGDSAGECTRWGVHTKFAGAGQCGSEGLVCAEQGDQASCVSCSG